MDGQRRQLMHRRRLIIVIKAPRWTSAMTRSANQIIWDGWSEAVKKLDNLGSRAKTEALWAKMRCELDRRMAMTRMIHVQPPPAWMEMLTARLHRVRMERGPRVVGPKGAEHPPPEAFKGRLGMLAFDKGRQPQLQVHGAPCHVLVRGPGRGQLALQAGRGSGMDPPALIVVASRRPHAFLPSKHAV